MSIVAILSAITILAFFLFVLGRVDSALHPAFLWALNLFTAFPGDTSWALGNLLYRLLFGAIVGVVIGLPMGLAIGKRKIAAFVAFVALLPSLLLTAWLVGDDPWQLFTLAVVASGAPSAAWFSSRLRTQRAP
jgi:NhaP-type Na+/H+ or K+/H+ antiporter